MRLSVNISWIFPCLLSKPKRTSP